MGETMKPEYITRDMENKQTAVEWLQEQLECFGNKHELQMSWATVDELVEQAKAMEKQQIIDAAERWKGTNFAEQYYNETYNK
jgi:hypothetical protein